MTAPVTVTQADTDRALRHFDAAEGLWALSYEGFVGLLANHRIAAETASAARVAALVEALERLCRYEGHMVYCGHGKDETKPCVCGLIDAHAAARNALAHTTPDADDAVGVKP